MSKIISDGERLHHNGVKERVTIAEMPSGIVQTEAFSYGPVAVWIVKGGGSNGVQLEINGQTIENVSFETIGALVRILSIRSLRTHYELQVAAGEAGDDSEPRRPPTV